MFLKEKWAHAPHPVLWVFHQCVVMWVSQEHSWARSVCWAGSWNADCGLGLRMQCRCVALGAALVTLCLTCSVPVDRHRLKVNITEQSQRCLSNGRTTFCLWPDISWHRTSALHAVAAFSFVSHSEKTRRYDAFCNSSVRTRTQWTQHFLAICQ